MGARSGSDSGGGGAVIFVVLVLVGVVVHYFWWIVGAAALVGLFFAGRALARTMIERRDEADREHEELAYRADQQNRWTGYGDSRGVYGSAGAELMREISPQRRASGDGAQVAAVACTARELQTLVADKPPGWRWALFASVLVQRRATVQSRLRDCHLGFSPAHSAGDYSAPELALLVTAQLRELTQLVEDVEAFMLAPGFMASFGEHGDESTADPDAIMHIANRLMDYHERLLALAERCRALRAPAKYTGLVRDCSKLMTIPLDGYRQFVEDFVALVDHLPDYVGPRDGPFELQPVKLHISVDNALLKRITRQLRAAAKG